MKFTTFLLALMSVSMISAQVVSWQKIDKNAVSSAGDFERNISIAIYPNPFQDHFFINSQHQIKQIIIYDLSGKKIFEKSEDLTKTNPIDTSKLKAGVYLLQVTTGQKNFIRKIIKK